MGSTLERIKKGIEKYQTPQGNPVDQLKGGARKLVEFDKKVKEKVDEAADVGAGLVDKVKGIFKGTDTQPPKKKE